MTGKILQVPKLFDHILAMGASEREWKDWRMSVETNADETIESAIMQESLGSARLVGCKCARGT